jgi:hypothetical protein
MQPGQGWSTGDYCHVKSEEIGRTSFRVWVAGQTSTACWSPRCRVVRKRCFTSPLA